MATQTTTHVDELKINRLSKALYDGIANPSSNELYIVTDEQVDYSDLTNKPTIGSATLTIQKNGTTVQTFGANATSNVTANITVPTTAADVNAVAANTAITGATKCKITYDSKGLVTAGANLAASDIPNLSLSKITDVTATAAEVNVLDGITATTTELNYVSGVTSAIQTQLDNKVTKTTSNYQLYGTNGSGVTTSYTFSSGNTASTMVYRTADSQVRVAQTPTGSTDATSKKYVDDGLSAKQETLVSGTNIKTINNNSLLGSGNITIDSLPSQASQSGKFLTTNGTTASWATVDALPSQTSQSGKFLTTNGTTASWANVPSSLPSQSGNSGKYLTTNGTTASWNSLATVATSGSYNDLSNKLTAGTDITISNANEISCTHPEVYLTQAQYEALVDAGTVDANTYYNTSTAVPFSAETFITIRNSMSPGDTLSKGYMVLVQAS